MLYYDQRIFACRDNPQVTLNVFSQFMEEWRLLLNRKIDSFVRQELDAFVLVPPDDEYYEDDDYDEDEDDEDDEEGNGGSNKGDWGIRFDGESASDIQYTTSDFFKRQEIYNNKFNTLVNQDLYEKYKDDIQEIVMKLGRLDGSMVKKEGVGRLLNYSFSTPPYEDIEGVSSGGRIMDMLPNEFAIMSCKETEILFYQKLASRQLQLFSCFPKDKGPSEQSMNGPIIISIDTSGSMDGDPVDFARLVVIDAFNIAKREKRPLFIIQFSVGAKCLDLSGEDGEEALMDFLADGERGGSDAEEMLSAIVKQLKIGEYRNADALIISDFQFRYISNDLESDIKEAQKNGCKFYALNVRPGDANPGYEKLLNKIWEISLFHYHY